MMSTVSSVGVLMREVIKGRIATEIEYCRPESRTGNGSTKR